MKLECRVTKVSNSGESISIAFNGRQPKDAEWRRDGHQEIEITCSEKAKRAFWLGRRVTITVEPR